MRTVWKYTVPVDGLTLTLVDPLVVHVGVDPASPDLELPTVWVEHRLVEDPMRRQMDAIDVDLSFVGTGHAVKHNGAHVGSTVTPSGLVWHVYQATS
jgi:hypothetical protein